MLSALQEIERLERENAKLRAALTKLVLAIDDDPEVIGAALQDPGCIQCTAGATPDRFNTGLCGYHLACKALGEE